MAVIGLHDVSVIFFHVVTDVDVHVVPPLREALENVVYHLRRALYETLFQNLVMETMASIPSVLGWAENLQWFDGLIDENSQNMEALHTDTS